MYDTVVFEKFGTVPYGTGTVFIKTNVFSKGGVASTNGKTLMRPYKK